MSVPRILVTDAQDRAGLAAVRCLNAGGYRVTASAIDRLGPGLWSRGATSRRLLPDPREDGVEIFIERLVALLREHPHDVLLPVRDETLYAVSAHREQLLPYVKTGLPPHELVERALDKNCLAVEARNVGFGSPEDHVCESLEQALEAAHGFGFPVLVKGVRTIDEIDDRSVRYKSRWVADEAALRRVQQQTGACIVQRCETGPVIQFGGVVTDRGLVGALATRSRRTWPPEAGNPCFLETIAVSPDLLERVGALVDGIGWRGVFQLELIERADGVLSAIDFNARPYGSIGLARPAGAPLITLWCDSVLNGSPQPARAAAGVGYRWELGDAQHIVWQARNGDWRGALTAARPRRGTVHAHFDRRDPLPFVSHCVEMTRALSRFTRRRLRRSAREPR
jgi:predicted ATP-grasp superfamily ATP-dependent carboligase